LEGNEVAALSAFENERHAVFKKIGQAMTYHAQGEVEISDKLVDELIAEHGESIAFYLATIFAFRHDNDDAFSWLEKAKLAGDSEISNVHNEPLLNNLHIDPRWLPFLDSVGQSKEALAAITLIFDLPGL
jgi:adenylate cyclase